MAAACLYDGIFRRRYRLNLKFFSGFHRLKLIFPGDWLKKIPRWLPRLLLVLILPLVLYSIWAVAINTPEYASNYSHFSEAMKAKFEFYNVKPADPSKLSYDARILWTPSMHSATWDILISFFPSLFFGRQMKFSLFHFIFGYLPVTLAFFAVSALSVILFRMFRQRFIRHWQIHMIPFLYTIGFTAGFVYIVRYHEFVILFLSVSLPLLILCIWRACAYQPEKINPAEAYTCLYGSKVFRCSVRTLLILGCIFCLCWETYASLGIARRKYTGDVALQDTARLIVWFRAAGEKNHDKGVAANITIGPMLHAYAGTGVVMNPQFGLKRIRDATQEYLETLYHGSEEDLARYCEDRKAQFLVYNRGAIHDMSINSNRYIANARNIASTAPASLMYYRPDRMEWFYELDPPRGLQQLSKTYTVFKVVTPSGRKKAMQLLAEAQNAIKQQNPEQAKILAKQIIELDPVSNEANMLYHKLFGHLPVVSIRGLEHAGE